MRAILTASRRLLLVAAAVLTGGPAHAQSQSVAGKPLGQQLEICAACHGDDGNAKAPDVPSLAGQQPLFITNQLILFREGLRKSDLMTPFVQGLKDDEITALAAALAKLPLKPEPVVRDAVRAARGATLVSTLRCDNCHLPSLLGREQIPRIAGQREDYLRLSMRQYRDNQRVGTDTSMAAAMYGVVDADVAALAHFIAAAR